MAHTSAIQRSGVHSGEKTEYWVYVSLLYPVFLAAAVIGRLNPFRKRRGARAPSLFAEAAQTAHAVVPWVFGGR